MLWAGKQVLVPLSALFFYPFTPYKSWTESVCQNTGIKAPIVYKVYLMLSLSMMPQENIFIFYFNPINNSSMSVKEVAIEDIKDDLRQNGLCFLAFREDLDPIMDELVQMESEKQLIASIL